MAQQGRIKKQLRRLGTLGKQRSNSNRKKRLYLDCRSSIRKELIKIPFKK